MKERLLEILESKNLTASQLADKLSVQRSGISHILSGRNKPSIDFLQKLINAYPDIDIRWLISGSKTKGSQQPPQPDLFEQTDKRTIHEEKTSIKDEDPYEYTTSEKKIQKENPGKITEKIVIFYSDQSFEVYYPGGK